MRRSASAIARIGGALSTVFLILFCGCSAERNDQPAQGQPAQGQHEQRQPAPGQDVSDNEDGPGQDDGAASGPQPDGSGIQPSELVDPSAPVLVPPEIAGWDSSGIRELPGNEGFSVAYDHPTGVTLTLFQFDRGLESIPDSLESPEVANEMREARSQIQTMTEMGMWEMSEEMESGTTTLGESDRQVVYAKYKIRSSRRRAHSYIYLWSQNNQFLKIRMTCSPYQTQEEKQAISELLTALGNGTSDLPE